MDENEISARGIWSESDDIEHFIVVSLKFEAHWGWFYCHCKSSNEVFR